jgi:hypothetical protein
VPDIRNATELRDARTNKWLPDIGGIGYETWQLMLGVAVYAVSFVLIALVTQYLLAGAILGLVPGFFAAALPNYLNVRHKQPSRFMLDLVKQRAQATHIVNDKRTFHPPDIIERYKVQVTHLEPPEGDE